MAGTIEFIPGAGALVARTGGGVVEELAHGVQRHHRLVGDLGECTIGG